MKYKGKLSDIPPPVKYMEESIRKIAMGFERSQILFTAFELGFFEKLKEPITAEAFVGMTGYNEAVSSRMLDILTAMDFLHKIHDKYCLNPDYVPFLVKGEDYYSYYLENAVKERNLWNDLKSCLVNETPPAEEKTKFNYSTESIRWTARDCTHGRLQRTIQLVSSFPEFETACRLLDLGGGHGLFGIGFAQENPDLEVIIFDRPEVSVVAEEFIDDFNVNNQVFFVSGDYMIDNFGTGYEIIFEALSLEGGFDEAKKLYEKVSEALVPNGLFITQLFTIDDLQTSPLSTLTLDLRERITNNKQLHLMTNTELFKLFENCGLLGEQIINISMGENLPLRMIVARKVSSD
ncbi:methyltransferase [uncultured Methanolobus sp.]|uniref:methyltransferase n=1 Tax=uncultured Methanolobus sp. TaxID=218300 RepID=UPI002AAAE3D6|nr:methyltransferase [uncultured Methanolobus sp.]